jgi:hypothetical protein
MSMLGQHSYTRESGLAWIVPRWHEYLQSMPPKLLAETIERAHRLAQERPHSYLAHHVRVLYGERI